MAKSLRRQRWWLWKQDPRCYWCGVKTVLPSKKWRGPTSPNMATIDHLRPRHHPDRLEPANGERRHVLACHKCNNERDRIEHERMPRERLWEMSHSAPLITRPLADLLELEALLLEKTPRSKSDKESINRSLVAVRHAIEVVRMRQTNESVPPIVYAN